MLEFYEINMHLKLSTPRGYRYFVVDKFGELFLKDIHQSYDTPLLISLIDEHEKYYMAMCTSLGKTSKTWMIVSLTQKRLDDGLTGKVELRSIFEESENGVWMFDDVEGKKLCKVRKAELVDENLPDAGIFLEQE